MDGSNSNAALAKLLDSSVVLVLDCRGTIRGVAPLLLGYQQFDPAVNIAGVILNFVGGSRHESKLRQVVETYTDIPVLGAIQRDDDLLVEERYLGLIPSNEDQQAITKIQALGERIAAQVDCEKLLACTSEIPAAPVNHQPPIIESYPLRIAYAKDRAFGFYYADDLDTFRAHGAELIAFDTLNDPQLPAADALWIGGGFPEKCLTELYNNQSLRQDIQQKLSAGMPAYAECGGLMYLCENIHYQSQVHSMVGFIPANCHMSERPQGRGYTQFKENTHSLWSPATDQVINAHEFHYSYLND
jgi:cobyrinic acid a,c-diamide synthase